MASNRKRSRGQIKADNMGQGEGPTVPLQSDAPEESDLWTPWQLFPLDDDQSCHSKDRVGDWVGVELLYNSVKTEVRVAVRIGEELETRCGRESHIRPKGPWGSDELRSRKDADKMQ